MSPEPSPLAPPPATDLVASFVNTHAHGEPERLTDAAGFRAWLQEAGFGDLNVTDADAACARELREAVRTLLLLHTGVEPPGSPAVVEAERSLARSAVRHPVRCTVTGEGVVLEATQEEVPGVFGAIIAAITELALTGTWSRLKACGNPPCRGAFYDRSRNGGSLYDSPGCGSQVSMRAYRRRQRDI